MRLVKKPSIAPLEESDLGLGLLVLLAVDDLRLAGTDELGAGAGGGHELEDAHLVADEALIVHGAETVRAQEVILEGGVGEVAQLFLHHAGHGLVARLDAELLQHVLGEHPRRRLLLDHVGGLRVVGRQLGRADDRGGQDFPAGGQELVPADGLAVK
jgi:hypothetical protein